MQAQLVSHDKKEAPRRNSLTKALVTKIWQEKQETPTLTITDLAKKYGVSRRQLSRVLQPLKQESAEIAQKQLETSLKEITHKSVANFKDSDKILDGLIKDALNKVTSIDTSNMNAVDLKVYATMVSELKDCIYRRGSNQIALANTLKPLGVTTGTGSASGDNSPTVNILQIFVKSDGSMLAGDELDACLERKHAEIGEYLASRKKLVVDADVEVIE